MNFFRTADTSRSRQFCARRGAHHYTALPHCPSGRSRATLEVGWGQSGSKRSSKGWAGCADLARRRARLGAVGRRAGEGRRVAPRAPGRAPADRFTARMLHALGVGRGGPSEDTARSARGSSDRESDRGPKPQKERTTASVAEGRPRSPWPENAPTRTHARGLSLRSAHWRSSQRRNRQVRR